jgi:hypothetical protein
MKTTLYSLALAAVTCGLAGAQATTAYTTPVGYTTTSPLLQGFNVAGLTLHPSAVASGKFETVNTASLVDTGITFSPVAGRTYVLEFVTNPASAVTGMIFEIPAANIAGNTISVITTPPTDLVALGVTASDSYRLRLAPTLEEIFTTVPLANGGVLFAGANALAGDNVWIPNGSGGYDRYYLRSGSPAAFRNAVGNALSPNIPVIYTDGILIEKKTATPSSLVVSGEVKLVGSTVVVRPGFNLVNSVAPAGLNLFNAGLEDDIFVGANATAADNIWVQQPNLSYKKYFRRSGNPQTWRDVDAPAVALTQAQAEAVVLSNGFLIERKPLTTINVDLNVPASFSNL